MAALVVKLDCLSKAPPDQSTQMNKEALPSLLHIEDVFRQTDVERLWEDEDQAAADDARPGKDQRRQQEPDVLQQHDHRSQRAPDPADTRGVADTALPANTRARASLATLQPSTEQRTCHPSAPPGRPGPAETGLWVIVVQSLGCNECCSCQTLQQSLK